ncbi:MAG TPA: uracil-DNA glycosylase [Burkholderiales bacterium]|nr:uracil-DNA glycosylase [Burkholderiales bacterium]
MNARSERYLEEMGLGPVWKLRGPKQGREPETADSEAKAPGVLPASPGPESAIDDRVRLEPSWKARLLPEFSQAYMQGLREFLNKEKSAGKVIYPRGPEYFAALAHTPFDKVKVVILGQDPYHGPKQAHGLCFSVRPGVEIPPSLQNIFIELKNDLGIEPPNHGHLTHWAEQGVLLLNATLSVEAGKAGSHQNRGWEKFTDAVIDVLNREREGLVFVLWGSYAQKKGAFIDTGKHLVLSGPHPSPLSAHRGFFGCKHFSKINGYLKAHGRAPIDWRLPEFAAL